MGKWTGVAEGKVAGLQEVRRCSVPLSIRDELQLLRQSAIAGGRDEQLDRLEMVRLMLERELVEY
jgi:hypothetical protein